MSAIERCIQDLIRGDESDADLDKIVADLIVREAQEKNRSSSSSSSSSIDGRNSIEPSIGNSQSSARKLLNSRFLNGVVQSVERHNRNLKAEEKRDSEAAIARKSNNDGHHKHKNPLKLSSEGVHKASSKERLYTRASKEKGELEAETHGRARERYRQEGSSSSGNNESKSDGNTTSVRRKRSNHHNPNSENQKRSLECEAGHFMQDRMADGDRNVERQDQKRKREQNVSSKFESKMDKYFQSNYDPALDVDTRVHNSQNNMVDDEGWDRAMRVIEERKRAKKERRDERREGRKNDRKRDHTTKRRRRNDEDGHNKELRYERGSRDQIEAKRCREVLETQYTTKGSVREWDKGKR